MIDLRFVFSNFSSIMNETEGDLGNIATNILHHVRRTCAAYGVSDVAYGCSISSLPELAHRFRFINGDKQVGKWLL